MHFYYSVILGQLLSGTIRGRVCCTALDDIGRVGTTMERSPRSTARGLNRIAEPTSNSLREMNRWKSFCIALADYLCSPCTGAKILPYIHERAAENMVSRVQISRPRVPALAYAIARRSVLLYRRGILGTRSAFVGYILITG